MADTSADAPGHRRSGPAAAVDAVTDLRAVRAALDAVGRLYDRALDAMLATPHHVDGRDHALRLLDDSGGESDSMREQVTRVAMLATPLLRGLGRFGAVRRMPMIRRIPAVLTVTTVASVAAGLSRGVRDVQVIGSYVASRIEDHTGGAADPDLVKRVTVQLYLDPRKAPDVERRVATAALLRTWAVHGVFGRDGRRGTRKAIDAVHGLDLRRVLGEWHAYRPAELPAGDPPT